MVNTLYKRDFSDLSALKRPGRLDFRILGDGDDVGDGYPGLQRAIKNYFQLGYNEKDIDLNNFDLKDVKAIDGAGNSVIFNDDLDISGNEIDMNNGDLVNIGSNGVNINSLIQNEIDQIANINAVTISNSQWSYLGSSNQGIATSNTPSFSGLTLTSNLNLNANSITGTSVSINNAELQQLSTIGSATITGTQWGYVGNLNQGLATSNSPSFTSLTLGSLTLNGDVDMNNHRVTDLNAPSSQNDAATKDYVDNATGAGGHTHDGDTLQLDGINSNGGAFSFSTTGAVTFNQSVNTQALGVTGNISVTGNVDSVNVSSFKSSYDSHVGNTNAHIDNLTDITTRNHSSLQNIGSSDHHTKYALTEDLASGEITQIQNINSVTITNTQWGYLGALDQGLTQASSPTFGGLTLNGNLALGANSITGTSVDISNAELQQLSNIGSETITGTQWGYLGELDQSLTTSSTPTFGRITLNSANSYANSVYIGDGTHWVKLYSASTVSYVEGDYDLEIRAGSYISSSDLYFSTNETRRWSVNETGTLRPYASNTYDIGSDSYEVANLWYCTVHDTTCADFSNKSLEELYEMFSQIKPMEDGGLHYSDYNNKYYPHIDFKTLPDDFADKATRDMVKENVWELNEEERVVKRKTQYKKGDAIGIDTGNYLYALGSLVVKQHEYIKDLELRIIELEK